MSVPPIRLEGVSFRFGGRAAIDDLSLAFRRGAVTAVIGASGSGKSLVLKAAAGLLIPDEGTVFFEDRSVAAMGEEEYRRMQSRTGFHFQDAALWANKSLKENLSLAILADDATIPDDVLDRRVAEAFASVHLQLDPQIRPAAISMGQRKMVSFLRAVVGEPEVLFLDEPSTFLDPGSVRQILARIKAAKEAGTTIVLTTHDRRIGEMLADDVAVLDRGRIVARGDYSEVLESRDPALIPVLRELT